MQQRRRLVIAAAVVLVCSAVFGRWQWNKSREWASLTEKIAALPSGVTAEELERDGFLDLTEVQPGPVKEVTQFIQGNRRILSYFTRTEAGPLIHLFAVDKNNLLLVHTYSVQQKTWQAPNYAFSFQITHTKGEDGVTEVWVHNNAPQKDGTPNWGGYLLYRHW